LGQFSEIPLFKVIARSGTRRIGIGIAILVVSAYGWAALRGPQGVGALLDKHREIRELEQRNADGLRELERLRERIRRLQESPSEQEMEVRKQLKLLRPGETTFILPDDPKNPPKDGASKSESGPDQP
jgi:cell division protein FtsB